MKYLKLFENFTHQIVVPNMGEHTPTVVLDIWLKEEGAYVNDGDPICEIATDKANMEINADKSGILHRVAKECQILSIGDVIGEIKDMVGEISAKF